MVCVFGCFHQFAKDEVDADWFRREILFTGKTFIVNNITDDW